MSETIRNVSKLIISKILQVFKFIGNKVIEHVRKAYVLIKNKFNKEDLRSSNFHTLTPIVDISGKTTKFYIDSLKWAVNKEDCYNIALMGIYGSGKSSIIKSFLKKHNYKNLSVSLANFQDPNIKSGSSSTSNDILTINQLEKSIVQQIFYTVKETKLPNTGLKRIRNYNSWNSLFYYFGLILFGFCLIILIYPKFLCDIYFDFLYENFLLPTQIFALSYLLFIGFYLFKRYRHLARQISIKLKLQNAEIQLPYSSRNSIINEYLDELIYFFERNHQDIIVFEDLDRFDNIKVFSKLRELNLLLNNHEGIKRKGKVTFIYAVKDDLFGEDSKNIKT